MFRHLIALFAIIFYSSEINAQTRSFNRPENLFPNDPKYRPVDNNPNTGKNPFSDSFNREDPDDLFWGMLLNTVL